MSRKSTLAVIAVLVMVGLIVVGGVVMAKRPPKPAPGGCPWSDIQCPDVYDPVTCDNGVTYPNGCYAFAACATGCGEGGANL